MILSNKRFLLIFLFLSSFGSVWGGIIWQSSSDDKTVYYPNDFGEIVKSRAEQIDIGMWTRILNKEKIFFSTHIAKVIDNHVVFGVFLTEKGIARIEQEDDALSYFDLKGDLIKISAQILEAEQRAMITKILSRKDSVQISRTPESIRNSIKLLHLIGKNIDFIGKRIEALTKKFMFVARNKGGQATAYDEVSDILIPEINSVMEDLPNLIEGVDSMTIFADLYFKLLEMDFYAEDWLYTLFENTFDGMTPENQKLILQYMVLIYMEWVLDLVDLAPLDQITAIGTIANISDLYVSEMRRVFAQSF